MWGTAVDDGHNPGFKSAPKHSARIYGPHSEHLPRYEDFSSTCRKGICRKGKKFTQGVFDHLIADNLSTLLRTLSLTCDAAGGKMGGE